MKFLKSLSEFLSDGELECIVLIPNNLPNTFLDSLNEGIWKPSSVEPGIFVRVEQHTADGYRHVHVTKNKHKNSKEMQVSWNSNGSIHDKKSFNGNFDGMARAKNAARAALNLDSSIELKLYESELNESILTESEKDVSFQDEVFVFIASLNSGKQLLLG